MLLMVLLGMPLTVLLLAVLLGTTVRLLLVAVPMVLLLAARVLKWLTILLWRLVMLLWRGGPDHVHKTYVRSCSLKR
jgi:hypothetical protein